MIRATVSSWSCFSWLYAAAAAKSLQLCLTLCDPIDGSPPGSAIPGILQARTLEWIAIAFSPDYIELLHLWLQRINLISVLTIWSCPCVESSLVLLEEGVCYDQCVLCKILLAYALLHFVLQGQTCLLLQVSLDFLLLHSSPLWWKGHHFLVLLLEGLVGLHRTVQLQLLQH